MSADVLPLKVPAGLDRTAAFSVLRHAATLELNGHITGAQADHRIARHVRRDLTHAEIGELFETLKQHVAWLTNLTATVAPGSDLTVLKSSAEDDIEGVLRQLVGPRS
jgi:hypothetical protein